MPSPDWDRDFNELLAGSPEGTEGAPPSLKARLYTAFIRAQEHTGPLASLDASVAAGHGICVFEKLVQIAPIGETAKSPFFCGVCHARVLGETFDNAPIFWAHCPYVGFRKP